MNRRMRVMYQIVESRSNEKISIIQGAYMGDAEAGASGGTHRAGGCVDTETLTEQQIRISRSIGWVTWNRGPQHGMTPHAHWNALGDAARTPEAKEQEVDYRNGGDGLAGSGADYHWRPSPIPTFSWKKGAPENIAGIGGSNGGGSDFNYHRNFDAPETFQRRKSTAHSGPALNPTNGLEQIYIMGGKLRDDYRFKCIKADVSLTTDMQSQINLAFVDPDFKLMDDGLFKPSVPVQLGHFKMTIASISTDEVQDGIEQVGIACRPAVVRALKERTGTKVMKNCSPTDFMASELDELNVGYLLQDSPVRKRCARDIKKKGGSESEEEPSSWTTFQRFAGELGYICFESAGSIFMGQPTWLVDHYEDNAVKVGWKTGPNEFHTHRVPVCSQSIDGDKVREVTVQLPMHRWPEVRPGRSLELAGVPHFDSKLMISNVEYDLTGRTDEPFLSVTAATPINPEPLGWGKPPNQDSGGGLGGDYTGGRSLRALCEWAGFKGHNLDVAVAVSFAESGADAHALGDTTLTDATWGPSVGLFQIRSLKNAPSSGVDSVRNRQKLMDAMFNVKAAHTIWKDQGWSPWTQYTTGAYKPYMGKDFQIKNWTPPANYGGGSAGKGSAALMVEYALRQAGDSYVYGATPQGSDPNPGAFDCSSLVQWACFQAGYKGMPRSSSQQSAHCKHISVERAVRTRGALLWKPGHIAISLGNGKTIEAATPELGVLSLSAVSRSFSWASGLLVPGLQY